MRRGRGFSYHGVDGTRIEDPDVLERIRALAIPPAWTDVWICPDPRGHIQATGQDDAGRKQYRYHDDWRAHRDRRKFKEMLEFARALPKLRRRVREGLAQKGLGAGRVVPGAVALLDFGLFRIGSERYEDDNGSYGLTTLKVRHVSLGQGKATFEYPAKSGQVNRHAVSDADVLRLLRSLLRRKGAAPDDNLLGYREGREWRELTSEHVNAWIKETIGDEFSAKDFRTWNATVLAAVALAARADQAGSGVARTNRRLGNEAVDQVAEYLNNTRAVCRASYIDPHVFDRFNSGVTIKPSLARVQRSGDPGEFVEREAIERAVLRLLHD